MSMMTVKEGDINAWIDQYAIQEKDSDEHMILFMSYNTPQIFHCEDREEK